MQFLLILTVLAAIVAAEHAPAEPISAGGFHLALASASMLLVVLFAAGLARLTVRGLQSDPLGRRLLLRRFEFWRMAHTTLWLGGTALILFGLGWPQLVRFNWQLQGTFLLDDILILLPVLLPLVLSWAVFYDVDHALQQLDGRSQSGQAPAISRAHYLGFHIRHFLGMLLAPIFGLLAYEDTVRLFAPTLLTGKGAWMFFLPPLFVLMLLLPWLLRHVWKTEPLPAGPLRDRLTQAAQTLGFRPRDILVWHTGDRVVNAAVSGFAPCLRYVFLSDGLLVRFSDAEIEAVFAHEVGHIRQHHLGLRALAMLAPLPILTLLGELLPQPTADTAVSLAAIGIDPQWQAELLFPFGLGLYALTVFGWYSRWLEMEADLFACCYASPANDIPLDASTQPSAPVPSSPYMVETGTQCLVMALERLGIWGGIARSTQTWLHPSIARRTAFLERMCKDPSQQLQFRRRMRWAAWIWPSMLCVSLLLVCLS